METETEAAARGNRRETLLIRTELNRIVRVHPVITSKGPALNLSVADGGDVQELSASLLRHEVEKLRDVLNAYLAETTPADDLPELTAEERAAMDALPPDFIDRLLGGEKLEFGPDGKPVRWVKPVTPTAPPETPADREIDLAYESWAGTFMPDDEIEARAAWHVAWDAALRTQAAELAEGRRELKACADVAGEAIGTDPSLRTGVADVQVLADHAKWLKREWDQALRERDEWKNRSERLEKGICLLGPQRDQAVCERDNLLTAIVTHHGQKADDRCIEDDDRLYAAAALPPCDRRVGDKFSMHANCWRFITNRCESGGPWKSYVDLETERDQAVAELAEVKRELARLRAGGPADDGEKAWVEDLEPLGFGFTACGTAMRWTYGTWSVLVTGDFGHSEGWEKRTGLALEVVFETAAGRVTPTLCIMDDPTVGDVKRLLAGLGFAPPAVPAPEEK